MGVVEDWRMNVGIWVLSTQTVKYLSERELPFSSYTYNNLRTVDSGEGYLVNVMKRERTSQDVQDQGLLPEYHGLTLHSQHTGYNGCDVPLYGKHSGLNIFNSIP